ncbi:LytR C-terminal domain-containing protein [Arthrobacter sp.]|uniref:LytR C-terminal domain-containing protein n=1 Tax=Arthrobacter sp. TaxID=1667 RepID=UPI00281160A3|nr:LytR C-terminal domain-containing protein [Arthrobacter sp.]
MTQYPRDEFDRVPESAARQGVHRERLVPPRSSGLPLKIVAGLLVLAVGLAAYFLFPRLGLGQASQVTPQSSTAAPMPSITADEARSGTPSEEPSKSAAPAEPETPSTEPTPEEDPTSEPEPTPEATETAAAVDRAQPVAVLNATTVSGLASTAAGRLQADGWSVTQVGNWSGEQLQGSIVLYNGEEQRPTAEALAAVLGIGAVQGNAGFGNITVVVGPGFQ